MAVAVPARAATNAASRTRDHCGCPGDHLPAVVRLGQNRDRDPPPVRLGVGCEPGLSAALGQPVSCQPIDLEASEVGSHGARQGRTGMPCSWQATPSNS